MKTYRCGCPEGQAATCPPVLRPAHGKFRARLNPRMQQALADRGTTPAQQLATARKWAARIDQEAAKGRPAPSATRPAVAASAPSWRPVTADERERRDAAARQVADELGLRLGESLAAIGVLR